MQGTFLRNLALVLVLNLLVKPFYILGIDAGVQEAVGAGVYGGYAALLSLSFLLNILLDLGITNYNTRHIAQHEDRMREQVTGILGVRFLLVLFYAAVSLVVAITLGYGASSLVLFAWLLLNQALVATIQYLRSNIAAAQRFAQDSVMSVLDRALLIGIVGWLLWGRASGTAFRIEWFVWAQTAAYGVTAVVVLLLVRKRTGGLSLRFDTRFAKDIMRQSMPYALLILLMTFYYRTDTIMLERLLPDGALQAGIYAQAFRFFEALNMLGYLMAGLLLPMFSRMLKESAPVRPLSGMGMRLVWAGTLPLAVLGVVQAGPIMDLRYSLHTEHSAPVFAILMVCFVAVCTTYVYGTLLTAAGDLRRLNLIAGAGMVLNIGLNLWWIPVHGPLGAAWASLITQAGTALAQVWLASYKFVLWPGVKGLTGPAAYLFLLVGVGLVADRMELGLLINCSVVFVAALLGVGFSGLVRVNDLRMLGRSWKGA
ncbi:MAG: oligosaccharide flippase family protein [Flavobacteriales bacterium]|nr:oligosaccharide flippase family protein [Flavobacteriales bacterium]